MNSEIISDELCELDLDVKNTDEFFQVMSNKAEHLGYITANFLPAIQKREEEFPTALPTLPYPVAIPHSEPTNIVKQFIAPIRLKHAIDWCEMANNENVLAVRIIFLLGFKREVGHVELLQVLLENFQDEDIMNRLLHAETKEEYLGIVKSMKGFQ